MSSNTPYDPPYDARTAQVHKELEETQGRLQETMNKLGQRGENVEALYGKTQQLQSNADGFHRGANRVRKQMWWKDMKMRMCIIVGIIILLVVIIVPSVIASHKH